MEPLFFEISVNVTCSDAWHVLHYVAIFNSHLMNRPFLTEEVKSDLQGTKVPLKFNSASNDDKTRTKTQNKNFKFFGAGNFVVFFSGLEE